MGSSSKSTVLILILFLSSLGWSQSRIQGGIQDQGSPWVYAGLSLTVPGLGQEKLGLESAAEAFYLAELGAWLFLGASYLAKEHYISSAQDYAGRYANAPNAPRDEEFLQLMGEYQSRSGSAATNASPDLDEDYNQSLIRRGLDPESYYPNTSEYQWDWGSIDEPSNIRRRENYNDLLSKYRLSKIFFQGSIGILVLNRVVSSIHALRKAQTTRYQKSFWVPFIAPGDNHVYGIHWVRSF